MKKNKYFFSQYTFFSFFVDKSTTYSFRKRNKKEIKYYKKDIDFYNLTLFYIKNIFRKYQQSLLFFFIF